MSSVCISFENLAIGYDNKSLAENWSLQAHKGECIALLGLNGAGKSTLLRTLSGLQPALKGSISWNNQPLQSWSLDQQALFRSTVLTEKLIPTQFTVEEYIALGRMPYRHIARAQRQDNEQLVNQAMQTTAVSDLAQRFLHQLSDGQLQRVQIARALAQDTEVIFMDEPFSHLDLTHRAQIWQLLYDLTRKMNKTVIFSLHDLDFGWEIPTQYWLIHQGKLNAYTPQELQNGELLNQVYENPQLHFDALKKAFVLSLNR